MIVPVILCGGSGTRLWPLSRKLYPKQLLTLTGDHTLLQQTASRVQGVIGVGEPLVVCNEEHRFLVAEQLRAAATIRRIYAALTALSAQKGVVRPPHQTPLEFLTPLSAAWPDLSAEFRTITRAYVRVHYGQLPENRAGLEAVRRAWRTVRQRMGE